MGKRDRHQAILELVRQHRVASQEALRELLSERGVEVTQATLSRDIRELRLVKLPAAEGQHQHYTLPPDSWEQTPPLELLLRTLYVDAEGAGHLLVVKTLTGGAQPVAVALDWEEWPEVLGTIAGDDTILVILRQPSHLDAVRERIAGLAGPA
ncbi:MAG TPA: arginine repressor [Longimicrobiales bacterium]|nr:arginine repressor [Longimicrobiales bacterium]